MLSPAGIISESSKGHSIILLGQLFEDEGNIMIPENSMSLSPMLYFICYKMSFFVRNSVVWNTMMVTKAFYSPQMVVLAEALTVGKAKLYPA